MKNKKTSILYKICDFCMLNLEIIALNICLIHFLHLTIKDINFWIVTIIVAFCSGISVGYRNKKNKDENINNNNITNHV